MTVPVAEHHKNHGPGSSNVGPGALCPAHTLKLYLGLLRMFPLRALEEKELRPLGSYTGTAARGVHAALPHCVVVRGGPTQFNVLSLISHLQDLSVRTGLNRSVSNTIRF